MSKIELMKLSLLTCRVGVGWGYLITLSLYPHWYHFLVLLNITAASNHLIQAYFNMASMPLFLLIPIILLKWGKSLLEVDSFFILEWLVVNIIIWIIKILIWSCFFVNQTLDLHKSILSILTDFINKALIELAIILRVVPINDTLSKYSSLCLI